MSGEGALSGEEIQAALRGFVDKWSGYAGSERAEAQTFLNELFTCYGSDRQAVGAKFEEFRQLSGFMDLFWPGVCLVEMKAPGRLREPDDAREQARRYWSRSDDPDNDIPAAEYVVLCSFDHFEVWQPGRFPSKPRVAFPLAELPDRYETLNFLQGPRVAPSFVVHHRELTKEAAATVAQLYQSLADRSAAPIDEIQRFTMQCVWSLFAEDLSMLDGYPLQRLVAKLRGESEPRSAMEIGYFFKLLKQKTDRNRTGIYAGTRYVNGELFADPAEVDLTHPELELLARAAQYDWRRVDPTIFGSLMEGVLGRERRWELGAHYTHEADILKIVEPTITRPWKERIDACTSPRAARELLDELCTFRVLDPACGCGNFLYVAYRELRGLEHQLKERIVALAHDQGLPVPSGPLPFYPITNLQGIDIERVAVQIARVVLWMGHRQMIDLYGEAEPPLPLVSLPGIQRADALRAPWPVTDVIIGNPPFFGSQAIRGAMGDDYVAWLKREFGVGVKDFCTYWFRRAQDHLGPGQRAGLVGTNSISQNRARSASLDYIVKEGGLITDAVSSQKWPGEAQVHVSLVNWVKGDYDGTFTLDGVAVVGIDSSLHVNEADAWEPKRLRANAGQCFQGPIPVGGGFIIDADEAAALLADDAVPYADVVRRYLIGADILDEPAQAPTRWVIDFEVMPLEEARRYPRAHEVVKQRVKPERDRNSDRGFRQRWWQFGRPRGEMRAALAPLIRYPALPRHAKHLIMAWCPARVMASDATNVFAFDDDFSMGVLLSRTHEAWAWSRSSTLETRLRYTPTSVFMTFPWPGAFASAEQQERAAEACRRLIDRRSEICQAEQIGLTTLYNQVDEGAWADLKALHKELDEAVASCYGWPRSVAQDDVDIVRRLAELNQRITRGDLAYAPFLAHSL